MVDVSKNNSSDHPETTPPHKQPSSSPSEPDIITPVPVKPEKITARHTYSNLRKNRKIIIFAGVFMMAIIFGGWFLQYLSNNPVSVQQQFVPNKKNGKQAEKPLPDMLYEAGAPKNQGPEKPLQDRLQKETAENTFAEFQLLINQLEAIEVSAWGGDQHTQLLTYSLEADTLLMDQDYESATTHYQKAVDLANILLARKNDVFENSLNQGTLSLREGDGDRALHFFKIALLIEPSHPEAQKGYSRASNLESVQILIRKGMAHEQENNLPFALADYQEALRLDPDSIEADISLSRVKNLIVEEQFQQSLSAGLAAIHNNDHERARLMLEKAKSFKPESNSLKDALAQLDTAVRLKRIKILQEQAVAGEKAEEWQIALKKYMEVLDLESTIQFAQQGKLRAQKQLQISNHLNFYLRKPQLLESDRYLADAEVLLDETRKTTVIGPKRQRQIEKLDELIISAKTQVSLVFTSDGLTDVAVYKVGRFGSFLKKEIALRPGTYTVVGVRNGYKDVRQKIIVKHGDTNRQVTIVCTEKI